MKVYRLKIIAVILACCSSIHMYGETHKLNFDCREVDSVEIKMIAFSSCIFGGYAVDREHFDEIFYYHRFNNKSKDIDYLMIKDRTMLLLFISVLNKLNPYEENEIKVYPKDIKSEKIGVTMRDGWDYAAKEYSLGYISPNDPLETRGKMDIYMKGGTKISGFFSTHTIDILNYRYDLSPLSTFFVFYNLGLY